MSSRNSRKREATKLMYSKGNYATVSYHKTGNCYLPYKKKHKKKHHKNRYIQEIETEIRLKQFIEEFYKISPKLNIKNYNDYITSKEWKDKSSIIKRYYGMKCTRCGHGPMEHWKLHSHHLTYERVGNEQFTDLTSLCYRCHTITHNNSQ